jgi:hypothetical protein
MHTFPNGKRYVGITAQTTKERWRSGGSGYKNQKVVWRAITKYGWENIRHDVIAEGVSPNIAYQLEAELIAKYQTNNPLFGYNNSVGGESSSIGCKHSDEYKKKVSEGLKRAYKDGRKSAGERLTLQFTKDGHYLKSYKSKREASKATGIDEGNIGRCCSGTCKCAGGYVWKYK